MMKNALPVLLIVVLSFEASAKELVTVAGVGELAFNTFGSVRVAQLQKQAIFNGSTTRPNEGKDFQSSTQLQQHLRGMVTSLREADVSRLSPALKARRAFLIQRLEAYAERGVFPHNHVLPNQTPIFIDEHDTPCAVGQLIIDSGHRDLAERIRATDNTGYLLELDVEGLSDWIAASGFTAMELAHVQPEYPDPTPNHTCIIQTDLEGANARFTPVLRPGNRVFARGTPVAAAVEFAGKLYFVDEEQHPVVMQRVDDRLGPVVERRSSATVIKAAIRALAVADERLFSLEDDGVWVRAEKGNWSQLTSFLGRSTRSGMDGMDGVVEGRFKKPTQFQIRSMTEFWVSGGDWENRGNTAIWHFKEGSFELVHGQTQFSDFFATDDGRLFYVGTASAEWSEPGLYVTTNDLAPTRVLPDATTVFGRGNQVFAVAGTSVFEVKGTAQVEQSLTGLPTGISCTGASQNPDCLRSPSRGAVLADGRVVVVGPQGSLSIRSTSGSWQKKSLAGKMLVDVTEGHGGLVITAWGGCHPPAREAPVAARAAAPAKSKWSCSAAGESATVALFLGLAAVWRVRRRRQPLCGSKALRG